MKRIFIFSSLVLAVGFVLVFVILPKKQVTQGLPFLAKNQTKVNQLVTKKLSNAQEPRFESIAFKAVPTTKDLMDFFRTKPTDEIRLERARILKSAESRNLYAKANRNSMTAADRDQLAYVMRANTALSFLLIERELEQN
jgi:hypothetical protein